MEENKYGRKPVRCIETGEVYRTICAAAKANGISYGNLKNYFSSNKRHSCGGYTWERISIEEYNEIISKEENLNA